MALNWIQTQFAATKVDIQYTVTLIKITFFHTIWFNVSTQKTNIT